MSLDTMTAPELRAYITRMNSLKVQLLNKGEGVLAATVTPAVRRARAELATRH